MPSRDTPAVIQPGPDGLSRNAAEAAWHAVTPSIAGTPHVRISRDGGRTYPARHARPIPAESPGQPCTVPVYDPGTGSGRLLALDLDPGRTRISGEVEHQAAALGQLLSPSGGRHVYVLFAGALPWLELRDVVRALALRFPAIDTAPMSYLGGQISPPGSRSPPPAWSSGCSPTPVGVSPRRREETGTRGRPATEPARAGSRSAAEPAKMLTVIGPKATGGAFSP